MKSILVAAAVALSFAAAGTAQASEELAKANGCMTCHNVTGKKMGPGLKDVGAKNKSPADQAKLVEKLSSAKGHPQVKAKPEDLKAIVAWMAS
jgi:cytochrome c551/c552